MKVLFALPDFSLQSWLSSRGLAQGENLSPSDARQLETTAGLAAYLKDSDQCNRTQAVYQSSDNSGWNNGRWITTLPLCMFDDIDVVSYPPF